MDKQVPEKRVPFFLPFLCTAVHAKLSFLYNSLFFTFSIKLLASHPAFRMPVNRKRKQKRENEAKTEIIS